MALPWFPFNIKAYVTDTMNLDTEGHGAYLLLILHYYSTEKPIPDSDRQLAAICKLPMDRWRDLRPSVEGFFTVTDGQWVHERIRDEIRDGHDKHSAAVARVAAATAAAAAKRANKGAVTPPSRTPPRSEEQKLPRKRDRHKSGDVSVTVSATETQEQVQEQILVGGGRAGASEAVEPMPSPAPDSVTGIEDALDGAHEADMGTPVDLWKPQPGVDIDPENEADVKLLNQFAKHHMETGLFSRDWPTLWRKFHDDATRPKRAPPRIETNKRPEPMPGVRVKISPEAMALATKIEVACGLEHSPQTVGFPAMIETWLASWPAEVIERVVIEVMEKRWKDGAGPPASMKYFATPIARAVAEATQPVPTNVKPNTGSAHDRRHANSASAAASRLADRLAAGKANRPGDGGEVLLVADGTVSAE